VNLDGEHLLVGGTREKIGGKNKPHPSEFANFFRKSVKIGQFSKIRIGWFSTKTDDLLKRRTDKVNKKNKGPTFSGHFSRK
jgi:hypothetical protein